MVTFRNLKIPMNLKILIFRNWSYANNLRKWLFSQKILRMRIMLNIRMLVNICIEIRNELFFLCLVIILLIIIYIEFIGLSNYCPNTFKQVLKNIFRFYQIIKFGPLGCTVSVPPSICYALVRFRN